MFEADLMRAHKQLLSLCYELCSNHERTINAYIYLYENFQFFDVFFQSKGKIKTPQELAQSSEILKEFYRLAYDDVNCVLSVYHDHNQTVPVHSKLEFDLKHNQFHSKYIYQGEKDSEIDPNIFFASWWRNSEKARWKR